ncbi:hypothetical protein [Ktedonobacter robiniae]|uniref:Uncharacterized protein n=1 Tax=Ktedonobacter robiniae TaxID=2778365 RepID=A0ABQ3V2F0_9CHLR|nr:hypothetical protein [Ktedonobacter robiniae]GHO58675.1 hypothetical protein KSB_71500 [Ktedonobacter robiniae]
MDQSYDDCVISEAANHISGVVGLVFYLDVHFANGIDSVEARALAVSQMLPNASIFHTPPPSSQREKRFPRGGCLVSKIG